VLGDEGCSERVARDQHVVADVLPTQTDVVLLLRHSHLRRILIGLCDPVPVDSGEHVRRASDQAVAQSPRTAKSSRDAIDKLLRSRMHRDKRISYRDPVSDVRHDHKPRPRIHLVLLANPSRASCTSSAFPTVRPSGVSIAVTSATVRRPAPSPSSTISAASCPADATSGMNAPRPNFTSRTIASAPAAIFFDITLEAINGMEGTVAVTSRSAYISLSAGTMRGDCDATAIPTSRTCLMNRSGSRSTVRPGTDSSLSRVPPVWARARPLSFGTLTPHAAASGAAINVTLSPTPPVECLSTLIPGLALRSSTSPLATIAWVRAGVSAAVMPRMQTAISQAAIW